MHELALPVETVSFHSALAWITLGVLAMRASLLLDLALKWHFGMGLLLLAMTPVCGLLHFD